MTTTHEGTSVAHATSDGHVCGPEASMRAFALAIIRNSGAEEVWVEPEHTYIRRADDDHLTRYTNGAQMREALDRYLLTGQLPEVGITYRLEAV